MKKHIRFRKRYVEGYLSSGRYVEYYLAYGNRCYALTVFDHEFRCERHRRAYIAEKLLELRAQLRNGSIPVS